MIEWLIEWLDDWLMIDWWLIGDWLNDWWLIDYWSDPIRSINWLIKAEKGWDEDQIQKEVSGLRMKTKADD